MKYPLTETARTAAKDMLDKWDRHELEQFMEITTKGQNVTLAGLSQKRILQQAGYPLAGILMEMAKYGLIDVKMIFDSEGHTKNIQILLLQELRNAVENDFDVSEYFLTMNAVGTVVQGDLAIHPDSMLQSIGINIGTASQTLQQVTDEVSKILGDAILQTHTELKAAIDDLRKATAANQPTRVMKLVSLLSGGLEDTANTATILSAIFALTPLIQQAIAR